MVPPVCSSSTLSPGLWGAICLGFACVLSAQETAGESVSEIPARFFQTQDANGFFWQAAGNGAVTSGETQYLQSGLNWIVNGMAFAPTSARVRSPDEFPDNAGVTLEESRESLTLKRDLWIDRERGGVRSLDTILNTGGAAVSLEVVLRTTYPFAWQSLHGVDGELLSKEPVLNLDDRDFGLVVHFSAAEGRHDTFLVVGGEGEALRPRLSASNNRRELSLTYQLVIPPGGSQSLLHWIGQRSLPGMDATSEAFSAWYAKNELVAPGVSSQEKAGIVNIPASAFPREAAAPGGLGTLLPLNQILDSLGIVRRNEDIHWVSSSNRVSGTIESPEPFKILANHVGEISLPLSDLAAIRGGGGVGRKPVFFLRNGEVRVGEVLSGSLTITASGSSEAQPIDPAAANLLMMRTSSLDGTAPDGATGMAQLMDQSVFALASTSELTLPLLTPWGQFEPAVSALLEVAHVSRPFPTHRFLTEKGSLFSGFLDDRTLDLPRPGGDSLRIPAHLIDRIWKAGATAMMISSSANEWLSLDEVPGNESGGFLFRGNAFLCATLADGTMRLEDSGAEIQVNSDSVQSIQRDLSSIPSTPEELTIELLNGEILRGVLSDPFIALVWQGRTIQVPVESLIAFQLPVP